MADRFAFSPETLIKAYSLGVFPMAESADSRDIRFYDPEVRALIPLAWHEGARHEFHLPRRLARTVRQRRFKVTIDRDFAGVIDECAALKNGRKDTWINRDIRQLYLALHRLGFAHSIEVWQEDRLVGGLYGVALRSGVLRRIHVLAQDRRLQGCAGTSRGASSRRRLPTSRRTVHQRPSAAVRHF